MKEKDYFTTCLRKVIKKKDISREEAYNCLKILLDKKLGIANDSCFGAFLASLETKTATIEEISGLMDCVLKYDRIPLNIRKDKNKYYCGIVGSGKDELKTFNISSISSIVAASAGVKVVKNGSRSEASIAGTTDIFEYLGLNVYQNKVEKIEQCMKETNFCFCDVKNYFPKMNKEYMGKFYFVHPLSYILPIASGIEFDRVLFGLASDETEKTAKLLLNQGYKNSMVVAGHDENENVFDEISNVGTTKISEIKDGIIKTYEITPEDLGIKRAKSENIVEGKNIKDNAQIFMDILKNKEKGSKLDVVLINSGALIYLSGIAKSIKEGIIIAKKVIENGTAYKNFEKIIKMNNDEV